MTTTGILFTYTTSIRDPSKMQLVDFAIDSPFTNPADVLSVNVATLAMLGKTVEQILVDHVEHQQRVAARRAAER
jgi:hypothetical protein